MSMNDKNKVRFGLSNLHIAFATDEFDQGKPLYEEPIPIMGAVNLNLDNEENETPFHADNITYYSGKVDNGKSGDLEMAKFPDDILVKLFDWEYDKHGGVLELTNMERRVFALGGQVEGDKMGRRFWFYNCLGGKPKQSYGTLGGSKDVKTETMKLTILPMDLGNGKVLDKYSIARGGRGIELYDAFFEKVYIPNATDIQTSSGKSKNTKGVVLGG